MQCPAVKCKSRCRMHGGANGSGAPTGERNGAWRHGERSRKTIELRREVAQLLSLLRATAEAIED